MIKIVRISTSKMKMYLSGSEFEWLIFWDTQFSPHLCSPKQIEKDCEKSISIYTIYLYYTSNIYTIYLYYTSNTSIFIQAITITFIGKFIQISSENIETMTYPPYYKFD